MASLPIAGTDAVARAVRRRSARRAAGGPRWWWMPRVRSVLLLSALGVLAGLARIFAQFETDWLWFNELGQERVFWTILASKWLTAGLAGLGTTAFLLANFWVVERTAPRDAQLPRGRPSTARLRRILLPAYLALSVGAGLVVGRNVAVADWQHVLLWLHRSDFGMSRSAVPSRPRLLRLLPAALPEGRPLAVPDPRPQPRVLDRGARRNRRDPHEARAGVGHPRSPRSPARPGRPPAPHHRLAALARPVRSGAPARGREPARRGVHRRARRAPVAARARGGLARRRGHAPLRGVAAVLGAPRHSPGGGRLRRARQPRDPALGRAAFLRRPPDPVARASLPRPLRQVHPAGLRAGPRRRSPASGERHDLRPRAAREPGRPSEHPALGYRRPETADRPAAVDRLLLHLPQHHRRPLPPGRSGAGDDPRPAGARPAPAGTVGADLGERPARVHPRIRPRSRARGWRRARGPAEVRHLGVRCRAAADQDSPATHLLRRPAARGAAVGGREDEALRDREAASRRHSAARVPLRRRRRDPPRGPAAPRDVRPPLRRAQPRAVQHDHGTGRASSCTETSGTGSGPWRRSCTGRSVRRWPS